MQIWLLKDDGDFGNTITAYRTKKAAQAALITLIQENWEGDMEGEALPTCSQGLIKMYSEFADGHGCYLSIEPVPLKD